MVVRESTDFYAVEDKLVAQSLQFIAANSHRDINCEDVAKALSVHPRTLQRRFRKVVAWPIVDEFVVCASRESETRTRAVAT